MSIIVLFFDNQTIEIEIVEKDYYLSFNSLNQKSVIISALPFFLFGLLISGITIFLFVIGGPRQIIDVARASIWHNSAIIVGAISLFVLVYSAILAINNHLPVWSYTWLGAILTGFLISLILVGEDRDFMISKTVDISVVSLALISCIIIYCYTALKGWQHSGLISIGFCATFGLSLFFFGVAGQSQFYLGILSALLGLLETILIFIYRKSNSNSVRSIIIIVIACINIGIAWIIESIFRASNPSRDMSQFWILVVLLTGLLVVGVLGGVPGQFIRHKFNLLKNDQ